MEQAELRKRQEFERRKQTEREKKKNRVAAHRKVVARQLAKQYLQGARRWRSKALCDMPSCLWCARIAASRGSPKPSALERMPLKIL